MDSFRKTAKTVVIDEGIESKTTDFAEQVCRGMQSLCAEGAGSGEPPAGVKWQSPLSGQG